MHFFKKSSTHTNYVYSNNNQGRGYLNCKFPHAFRLDFPVVYQSYCILLESCSIMSLTCCGTVTLRNFFLTDRRASLPLKAKTVYLLRRKSFTWFGLNFSIFSSCQVEIPDEKAHRHVYLLGKNINKPLVLFLLATVGLKFSSSNLSPKLTSILGA